jgi:hypothetical protein
LQETFKRLIEDSSVFLVEDFNFHQGSTDHVSFQFFLAVGDCHAQCCYEIKEIAVASDPSRTGKFKLELDGIWNRLMLFELSNDAELSSLCH